ncbi:MAG: hypothetical protein ACLQUY_25325 [Ktedonobacterales bacterium]
MTTLRDCLQEVISNGSELFIRSYAIPGAYRTSEWEPVKFLDELQRESPGVLEDDAWGEWVNRPVSGLTFYIHYGYLGWSMSHREVPGYGHLRALEVSQRHMRDTVRSTLAQSSRF